MKDTRKNQKGITLIALVITIIVLIILSAVGIAMLTGDNGILENARWSKEAEEFGAVDDAIKLYINEKYLNEYGSRQEKVIAKVAQTTDDLPITQEKGTAVKEEEKCPVINKQLKAEEENGEKGMEETLKETIRFLEGVDDVSNEGKVKLMYIDREELRSYLGKKADDVEEDEYVLNVISKNLYWTKGHKHKGKIYHTLRYGVAPSSGPKEEEEKPDETKVTIHYLPGEGVTGSEYTQEVTESESYDVTLKPVEFTKENSNFFHWKDVTNEHINYVEEKEEEGEGGDTSTFEKKTGGYFDVANKLITILGEGGWQTDIIDIIEENEDYEPDPEDTSAPKNVKEQTVREIESYLSEVEEEIKPILTSGQSISGLANWFISDTEITDYLRNLELYELENYEEYEEDEENTEEETEGTYYADQEEHVNMGGYDMWLVAEWSESTVTLEANGGTINGKDKVVIGVKEGSPYGSNLKEAVRDGYVFAGWYTQKDGGEQIRETSNYDQSKLTNNTLYAHWEDINSPKVVTITYDANGGTMKDSDGNTVDTITKKKVIGTTLGTLPDVTYDGMHFSGWYTAKTGGNQVDRNTEITDNMTLFCQWRFVELDLQGGELYHTYKKAKNIEERFNQWNPVRNEGIYVTNGQKIGKQAKGRQLPGRYSGHLRKIRKVRIVTTLDGKQKELKAKWKGWYTQLYGQGTKIKWNTKWKDEYGTKLYAYWRDKYVITYNANGGTFGTTNTTERQKYVYENNKYAKINKPKRDGYTFIGWYDRAEGGNEIKLYNQNDLVSQDITLYAHWEEVKFDVTVTNVGTTTWKQGANATSGSLKGYKKTYYISTKGPNDETASTQTSSYVSGKSDYSTYYVWAVAKIGDVTIKSNNYMAVSTGHTHTGSRANRRRMSW